MKQLRLNIVAILICFLPVPALTAQPEPNNSMRLFDYDSRQPLDVHDKILKKFRCGVIHDTTYLSPSGGPVSAYEIIPEGKGPFAAIVFGHWGNGTRGEFIPEAKALACAGVISLLPDYRWDRVQPWYSPIDDFAHPDVDRKLRINTVIEMRRAFDLLLTRPDVDSNRVGYVGHSFGAQWGAILAAVDGRLKVAVLMAGVAEEADVLERSNNPRLQDLRASLPKGQLNTYLNTLQDINAINYIGHAQAIPVLLQFANFEQYVDRVSMDRYADAARAPKTVLFYDSAHDLNDPQAFKDRFDWLVKHLSSK